MYFKVLHPILEFDDRILVLRIIAQDNRHEPCRVFDHFGIVLPIIINPREDGITVGDLDKPFDELRKFGDKIPVLRGEMTSGWLQHIAATPELMAEKLSADRALTAAEMKCAIDSATAITIRRYFFCE